MDIRKNLLETLDLVERVLIMKLEDPTDRVRLLKMKQSLLKALRGLPKDSEPKAASPTNTDELKMLDELLRKKRILPGRVRRGKI